MILTDIRDHHLVILADIRDPHLVILTDIRDPHLVILTDIRDHHLVILTDIRDHHLVILTDIRVGFYVKSSPPESQSLTLEFFTNTQQLTLSKLNSIESTDSTIF